MMATTLYLDGIDSTSLGFYVDPMASDGWLDAGDLGFAAMGLVGRRGGVVSRVGESQPRMLVINGRVNPATYGAANREATELDLKRFHGKLVRVQLDDGSTAKEITGRLTKVAIKPKNWPTPYISSAALTFLCAEGSWRALTGMSLALSTTRQTIALGNAPVHDWLIQLHNSGGTVTNPTITIRNAAGATLFALAYTGTITSTQYLELDAALGTVLLYSAGASTNVLANLAGGLPPLDPWDGLTIQLSSTGGTPTGILYSPVRYE